VELFAVVLQLSIQAGLVEEGTVAPGGAKMNGNLSLTANRSTILLWRKKHRHVLYGKGHRGDALPEELARRKSQLARLRDAKVQLEQQAREKAVVQEEVNLGYVLESMKKVCPEATDTALLHHEVRQGKKREKCFFASAAERPLHRMGQPKEIARAVLFLARTRRRSSPEQPSCRWQRDRRIELRRR